MYLHSRVTTSAVGGILLKRNSSMYTFVSLYVTTPDILKTHSSMMVCVLSKLGSAETTWVTSSLSAQGSRMCLPCR